MPRKQLYFDFAATTPVAPEVVRAMQPYFNGAFGNPGSLHSYGQEAINALDRARETFAAALGCNFRELVFTASATEANNLAITGTLIQFRAEHPEVSRPRVIISSIEHESVADTAHALAAYNVEVIELPVNKEGYIDPAALVGLVNNETALVSIMYGNNEVGAIEPIADVSRIIATLRAEKRTSARFHTDASQAFQYIDCSVEALCIDLMTLSSHKIYGPKGVGLLYVRGLSTPQHVPLAPIVHGGGQEYGLRSGTENVPAIVGFAAAAAGVLKNREQEAARITALKKFCWDAIKKVLPRAQVNGPRPLASVAKALPHILNIHIPSVAAQDILTALDLQGIAVSAGSACSARSLEASTVIQALGYSRERAQQSIRISFGRTTKKADISRLVQALKKVA